MKPTVASSQATARNREVDRVAAMLSIMSAQIEAALHDSEEPAAALVETAHAMSRATQTIAKGVMEFSGSPARVFQDLMMLHDDLHIRSTQAVTAVQFHDRLTQCLTHVSAGLNMLAEFITDEELSNTSNLRPAEDWVELRHRIRALLSMQAERALFDRLSASGEAESGRNDERPEQESGLANESGKLELF